MNTELTKLLIKYPYILIYDTNFTDTNLRNIIANYCKLLSGELKLFKKSLLLKCLRQSILENKEIYNVLKSMNFEFVLMFLPNIESVEKICAKCENSFSCSMKPVQNIANEDVIIPKHKTNLYYPTYRRQFENLAINIKQGNSIFVEVITPKLLVKKGGKCSYEVLDLLNCLHMKYFKYSMIPKGLFYNRKYFKHAELNEMRKSVLFGLRNLQNLSVELNFYNSLTAPYYLGKYFNIYLSTSVIF